ncbi:hypothetical protein [Siccibacter turicensis]|uniref:hypothetical protein n=1 Tax=Siccibacter turicensis TaxID=357233 RepID=UPI0013EE3037|nr:hypothetical protein [Siccibacter turicensis]
MKTIQAESKKKLCIVCISMSHHSLKAGVNMRVLHSQLLENEGEGYNAWALGFQKWGFK